MPNIPVEKVTMQDGSKESIIAGILENLPPQEVIELNLPSKARFYSLPDPARPITMRSMNFEDEKMIASMNSSQTDSTEDPLTSILKRCVDNLNLKDILIVDKVYLILKLREISYGNEFTANVTCAACHKATPVVFDLRNLPINYFEDDFDYPIEIELPVAKKQAKLKLPTVSDEQFLKDGGQALNQLWRFIDSIDGQTNKEVISELLNLLPLKDVHAMLDAISGNTYGIQTKVQFQCFECKENAVIELPITPDFFTVN